MTFSSLKIVKHKTPLYTPLLNIVLFSFYIIEDNFMYKLILRIQIGIADPDPAKHYESNSSTPFQISHEFLSFVTQKRITITSLMMDTFLTDQLIRSWRGPAGSYQADPSEADPTQPLTKLPLLFKTSETTKGAEHELGRRIWVGGRYMSVIYRQDAGKPPSVSCTVQYTTTPPPPPHTLSTFPR